MAEFTDIASIEIVCGHSDCGSRVLVAIAGKTPANCPSCEKALFEQKGNQWSLVDDLRTSIAALQKTANPKHVRLELRNVPDYKG